MNNVEILNKLKKLEQNRLDLTDLRDTIHNKCQINQPIPKKHVPSKLRKDLAFALKSPYSKYYEYRPLIDHINDQLENIISTMSTLARKIDI